MSPNDTKTAGREQDLQTELGRIERKLIKLEQRKEEILDQLEPGPAGDRDG